MSKYRRAAKIDANQPEIVEALRLMGFSVAVSHDDILVGHNGRTYWYEIKADAKSSIKPSQTKLKSGWKGHYQIVHSLDQILNDMRPNQ